MRWMMLGLVLGAMGGCVGQSVEIKTCDYALNTTTASASCFIKHNPSSLSFFVDSIHPVSLTIWSIAIEGYARLENSNTERYSKGEIYGMTELQFNGCADWGGHVIWNVTPEEWSLSVVGTCASAEGPIYLNGSVIQRVESQ